MFFPNGLNPKMILKDLKVFDMILLRNFSLFGALFSVVVIALGEPWTRLVDAGLGCPDWPGMLWFCYISNF